MTKRSLMSYRSNIVSCSFCKCYLSNQMGKYLTSAYNLAHQRACLTYCVRTICFRASQRRVLCRVLLVTLGAFSSLRFRIWHAFRMQLPALVTGRNTRGLCCLPERPGQAGKMSRQNLVKSNYGKRPVLHVDRNNLRNQHVLGAGCCLTSLQQGDITGSC